MGGIFRITKAEFIKIFKKPSVYIMGLLLAAVIVVGLFTFEPNNRVTNLVSNITGSTVSQMNADWNSGIDSDAKSKLDNNVSTALSMVVYYENLTTRTTELQTTYAEFLSAQANLNNAIINESVDLTPFYNQVKTKLQSLTEVFTNDYEMQDYDFYQLYKQSTVYKKYYNTGTPLGYLNTLANNADTDTATNFNTFYNTNDYTEKLNGISSMFITDMLQYNLDQINQSYSSYNTAIVTSSTFTFEIAMEQARQELVLNIQAFQDYLTALSNTQNPVYVMDSNTYEQIVEQIEDSISVLEGLDEATGDTLFDRYKTVLNNYKDLGLSTTLQTMIDDFELVQLDQDTINALREFVNVNVSELTQSLLEKINLFVLEHGDSELSEYKNQLLSMYNNYKTTSLNAITYIENELAFVILNGKSATEITTIKGYEDFNTYQAQEENVKIEYLVATQTFDQDYADVFSYSINTTNETNAWDFMFYAMKLSSVFIVLFAIIMSSNIVAYEFDAGTIKLLAIRPFKRYKILFGKLLAVMFFALVFVLFSAIIAFAGGWSSFAVTTTPILGVFNATTAYVMAPWLLMLINIGAILLEILFYVIIALSISIIFRSFAGAMTTSTIAYLFAMVLNLVFAGALWYSYIPFVNTDFFRFMGGVFNSPYGNSGLSGMFNVGLLSNANLQLSAIIYGGTALFILLVAYVVFRKRDI